MALTKEQSDVLNSLETEAKRPKGPCGRVVFNLAWNKKLKEKAKRAFHGDCRLEKVLSIGRDLANGNV